MSELSLRVAAPLCFSVPTSPPRPSLFCIPDTLKRAPTLDLLAARIESRGDGLAQAVRFGSGDVVGCITDDVSSEDFCFATALAMQTASNARALAQCLVEATRGRRQFLGVAAVRNASSVDGDYFVLCVQANAAWGKALLLPGGSMKHVADLLPMSATAAVPGLVSVASCRRGDIVLLVSSRVHAVLVNGSHRQALARLARAADDQLDCLALTVGIEPATESPLLSSNAAFRAYVAARMLALKPTTQFEMAADVSFPLHVGNLPVAISIGSTAKQVFILVQLLAGAILNCAAAADGRSVTVTISFPEPQRAAESSALLFDESEYRGPIVRRVDLPEGVCVDGDTKHVIYDRNDAVTTIRFEKATATQ